MRDLSLPKLPEGAIVASKSSGIRECQARGVTRTWEKRNDDDEDALLGSNDLALAISPAHAQQNVNCASVITSGTFNNVNVPANTGCTLEDSVIVKGNITVGVDASLDVEFIAVDGHIVANGAGLLVIDGVSVGHNVIASGLQIVRINESVINGNVSISGSSTLVELFPNTVNGNVNI
jgi:hypothetical protein